MAAVRVFAFLLLVAFAVQVTTAPLPDGSPKAEEDGILERLREAVRAAERNNREIEYQRSRVVLWDGRPSTPARDAATAAAGDWDALEHRARQLAQQLQAELRTRTR